MWVLRGLRSPSGGNGMYLVNEVFMTLQGEGYWTGRPAVFCRFSRCNLWTGREEDRATAICRFCDTDFLHGERVSLDDLIGRVCTAWPTGFGHGDPMVVLTGGEPTLQADKLLMDELHNYGFYIAIETNGTRTLPGGLDWVCVSPKAGTQVAVQSGDELKLVYPQDGADPELFERWAFDHFWLSPMDGPELTDNTAATVAYVLGHPRWRLNVQTHKLVGVR